MSTHFDDRAATWDDDPMKRRRATMVADAVREAIPLTSTTRLLEYGAGTGLVAQELADDVGSVTLADASAGMREVMQEKVASGVLPADARVWDLDLTTHDVPDERFDLIVTVLTLHHIPDVATALDGFATLLSDGGHLCVIDLEEEDGSFHAGRPDFDGHHGFGAGTLRELLGAAGFSDVVVQRWSGLEKQGRTYPLFIATGAVEPSDL